MILTVGNRSAQRYICHTATLYTENLICREQEPNLGLRIDRQTSNPSCLTRAGTAWIGKNKHTGTDLGVYYVLTVTINLRINTSYITVYKRTNKWSR
jgi:hypothetical protein